MLDLAETGADALRTLSIRYDSVAGTRLGLGCRLLESDLKLAVWVPTEGWRVTSH
jgi:hypothetical protein